MQAAPTAGIDGVQLTLVHTHRERTGAGKFNRGTIKSVGRPGAARDERDRGREGGRQGERETERGREGERERRTLAINRCTSSAWEWSITSCSVSQRIAGAPRTFTYRLRWLGRPSSAGCHQRAGTQPAINCCCPTHPRPPVTTNHTSHRPSWETNLGDHKIRQRDRSHRARCSARAQLPP